MLHQPLPQLDRLFLTDAGLESDMIFNKGFDLPHFASITMMGSETGQAALTRYFREFVELAHQHGTGVVLETPTWRASPDWAAPLELSAEQLAALNTQAVQLVRAVAGEFQNVEVIVSGCLGPRGDGYDPGKIMSPEEAEDYHKWQARLLAGAGADMLSAITMTNINEAIGIALAAKRIGTPVAISFTVETDGRLPTGDALGDAIVAVDEATDGYPAYYMVNCAHPSHYERELLSGGAWLARLRGMRANASRCSHAELDAMTELDAGNPEELGAEYRTLVRQLPQLTVLGGCCGTDIRHITAIAEAIAA
jgi:homocysteine S-methyltransferase